MPDISTRRQNNSHTPISSNHKIPSSHTHHTPSSTTYFKTHKRFSSQYKNHSHPKKRTQKTAFYFGIRPAKKHTIHTIPDTHFKKNTHTHPFHPITRYPHPTHTTHHHPQHILKHTKDSHPNTKIIHIQKKTVTKHSILFWDSTYKKHATHTISDTH